MLKKNKGKVSDLDVDQQIKKLKEEYLHNIDQIKKDFNEYFLKYEKKEPEPEPEQEQEHEPEPEPEQAEDDKPLMRRCEYPSEESLKDIEFEVNGSPLDAYARQQIELSQKGYVIATEQEKNALSKKEKERLKNQKKRLKKKLKIQVEKSQKIQEQMHKEEEEKKAEEAIIMNLWEAEKIWLKIQILFISDEEFTKFTDKEKIEFIRKEFTDFYNNFPIVSRYMICMKQYRKTAFKKYLLKCKNASVIQDPSKREKGYTQDQWVQRQADYVRFLWEEQQTGRVSRHRSNQVWQQAYKALTKEFKEFKELHDSTEVKVKVDESKNKKKLVQEAMKRLVNNEQTTDINILKKLRIKLQDKLFKQKYDSVIKQIRDDVMIIPHTTQSLGTDIDKRQEYDEEMKESEYKKKYKKMTVETFG
jgi:hypothetical protein